MDKFESCDDCIYSDLEESVCVQLQCIHAVNGLRERYIPKESVKEADLQPTCNQLATDTISRQAAIDGADFVIARDTSENNDVVNAMIAWKEYIKGLPSAQPDTSHWIPRHINSECAKCGGRGAGAFKFCPWCGRRMEGNA